MTDEEHEAYIARPEYRQFMFLQNRLWTSLNGLDRDIANQIMALLPVDSRVTVGDLKAMAEQIKADVWRRIDTASDAWACHPDPHDESHVQPVVLPSHWNVSREMGGSIIVR